MAATVGRPLSAASSSCTVASSATAGPGSAASALLPSALGPAHACMHRRRHASAMHTRQQDGRRLPQARRRSKSQRPCAPGGLGSGVQRWGAHSRQQAQQGHAPGPRPRAASASPCPRRQPAAPGGLAAPQACRAGPCGSTGSLAGFARRSTDKTTRTALARRLRPLREFGHTRQLTCPSVLGRPLGWRWPMEAAAQHRLALRAAAAASRALRASSHPTPLQAVGWGHLGTHLERLEGCCPRPGLTAVCSDSPRGRGRGPGSP
jgi:hypothetical protein